MSNQKANPSATHRSFLPIWLAGRWGAIGVANLLYIFVMLAWACFDWVLPQSIRQNWDPALLPSAILVIFASWHVAARPQLLPQIRRAWFLIGLAALMACIGDLIWGYLVFFLQVDPFPSISDIFYLAFYPLVLWGLLSFPLQPQKRGERFIFWYDLLIVFTTAAMFIGYFLIAPAAAVNNHNFLKQLVAALYPLGSLTLAGGMLVLLLRLPDSRIRAVLFLLLGGTGFFLVSDLAFGYFNLSGTYEASNWINTGWKISQLFFVLAALRQMHVGAVPSDRPKRVGAFLNVVRWLPFAGALLGYCLVIYAMLTNSNQISWELLFGALFLTALVIGRWVVSPSFNHLSLRTKLILSFVLVSGLSISMVAFASYLAISSNLKSTQGIHMKTQAQARAQEIGNQLGRQSNIMEGFVLNSVIQDLAITANVRYPKNQGVTQALLNKQGQVWKTSGNNEPIVRGVLNSEVVGRLHDFMDTFPGHADALLTDRYGAVIAATNRPDEYVQSSQDWWQAAYNNGQGAIYISQPAYYPFTQATRITIAAPVYARKKSEVLGIMRTTYDIQNILDLLATSEPGLNAEFDLLLPTGQILLPTGELYSLDPETLRRLETSFDTYYAAMSYEGRPQMISQAQVAPPDPQNASAFEQLDWILIDHQEPSAAISPINSARETVLLTTLAVLILTTGSAFLVAQWLAAPISRLTRVARQIAGGDLAVKASVDSQDEIGALANTFNTMLDTLVKTQRELHQAEAFTRSILHSLSAQIAVLDRSGQVIETNEAWENFALANDEFCLFGSNGNYIEGIHHIAEMVEFHDSSCESGIKDVLNGTCPEVVMEFAHHYVTGKYWFLVQITPLMGGSGGAVVAHTDITDLKLAQQAQQESEKRYRGLVDYSPDLIAVIHLDGRCLYINPAGVGMMAAASAEELVGLHLWDINPSLGQEAVQGWLAQKLAAGEPIPFFEKQIQRLDGTIFEAELRAIPISFAGQPAIQYILHDITERKKAEEEIRQNAVMLEQRVVERTEELNQLNQRLQDELAERQRLVQSLSDSETRFRLLFSASPDAIMLIDPDDPHTSWPIVDCNEAACIMNGYSREELIGRSIDVVNETLGSPEERRVYLELLRKNGKMHNEAFHRHKDGHVFPIDVATSLITFAGHELVLGIDRDITARKAVDDALQHAKEIAEAANQAKSEFLSRMSHELRTPMNAILGFAQLMNMSRKDPLSPRQTEHVKQIIKGGQHLLDLINEILDISRIEAGRLQVSPEPVPLHEIIQETLDMTAPLAENRDIQMQTDLQTRNNPYVMADRQRLKQVLLNLLSNAVKYNCEGGTVMVSCEISKTEVWRISIADTGPGISSEDQALLFKPFERLNADQSFIQGTGLGLALAKHLVELMHGAIGVDSTPGQGSKFWIELPSAESQIARLQRTGGTGLLPLLAPKASTILYIEDNFANYELIQQVLANYNTIDLLWATDPIEGMELACQAHPGLILLDLHLGGKDGGDVLRQLKQDQMTVDIPVVVISADATHTQIERLMSLGAVTYLTKPLDIQQFVQLIEELLNVEGL